MNYVYDCNASKVYGGLELFYISVLRESEWSVSRSVRFIPGEGDIGTYSTRDCVQPEVGSRLVEKSVTVYGLNSIDICVSAFSML
jgi:hypothetical protein